MNTSGMFTVRFVQHEGLGGCEL